ncbi:MAG: transcription termination/antitermination protein NusA [Verrucomicrobiales bacterium]|jgi:N utilization substance protein A|nr:transcription termination/antitermination protein NusA [Verrucomicrobiales bacterium]MBP9222805.1 transcription termination/antitermination protein NusA [Verrucomicrobiales bacterium]
MTNELLALFEYYEKEKGIKRDTMIDALETALLSASRKSIGPAREMRIHIDPEKGDIRAYATLIVRDRVANAYEEIDIFTARRLKPGIDVGQEMEVDITPSNFGRIAAQTAKQTMMQRLRQAEKELIYEEFKDRAGDIVSGTVRRFERGDVFVDLGKFEGVMHQRERVSTEEYNVGDRVRAYVVAVENGARGPEIILSRSHPNFVRRLFESEVSEIADRTVEIRSLAREAGYRTKVAVYSADEKVDPVGACVGLRGARVKNIVRELNNEKVDIIRWSDDMRAFVQEALKPAEIKSITIDEEKKSILVKVDEEELSKAIGRRGQNARLTARLIGWDVQVQKDESLHEAFEAQVTAAATMIAGKAGIDLEIAHTLVRGGATTVEMLANDVDDVDVAGVLGITVEEAREIRNKAIVATGGTIKVAEVVEVAAESAESTTEATEPVAADESVASDETEETKDPATNEELPTTEELAATEE